MSRFIKIFSLIIALFSVSVAYGQNYQTFNSGRISYFENGNSNVKVIRIDSVHFETDSVLFPMGNIRQISNECYTPLGASSFGAKIVLKANGENLFFNKNNDTILIKSSAFLNETWIAYQIPGNQIVTAQVTEVDTMSFLGINDSIKVISFQVYDQFMTPVNHVLNAFQVILSKNYGMIKTLNFYNFPDFISVYGYSEENLEELNICGLNNPDTGLQNIKWSDIYDFQPGDQLHIRKYQEVPDFIANTTYTYENLYIYRYLERMDYTDSIVYQVELTRTYNYVSDVGSGFEYFHDTISQKIVANPEFDFFPDEVQHIDAYTISYLTMLNGIFKVKSDPRAYLFYSLMDEMSECYGMPLVDGCYNSYDYYKNLGGPYYNCSYMPYSQDSRALVYYSSNGQTWGTPMVLSGINTKNNKSQVSIYPNPANNRITVNIEAIARNCNIEIYNVIGVKIEDEKLSNGQNLVDISTIPSGVYFYQIKSGNEVLNSGKFVKE